MKTIRRKHRELTVFSRNLKFIIFAVVTYCVLIFIMTGCTFNLSNNSSPKIYKGYEEVENNFYKNKESFQEAVCLLEESNLLDVLFSTTNDDSLIYTEFSQIEKYFSEEEYIFLKNFINEQGFYEIGQHNSIYFVYLCENMDVVLYYTELESDDLDRFLNYIGQHSNVKKIDDNWYLKYRYTEVTRKQ